MCSQFLAAVNRSELMFLVMKISLIPEPADQLIFMKNILYFTVYVSSFIASTKQIHFVKLNHAWISWCVFKDGCVGTRRLMSLINSFSE